MMQKKIDALAAELEKLKAAPFMERAQKAPALVFVALNLVRELAAELDATRDRVAAVVGRVNLLSDKVFKGEVENGN